MERKAARAKSDEELRVKWAANAAEAKARKEKMHREAAAQQAADEADRKRRPWRYWFPSRGNGDVYGQDFLRILILFYLLMLGLGFVSFALALAGKLFGFDFPM